MAKRRRRINDGGVMSMVTGGALMGAGGMALAGIGGTAATNAGTGIANLSTAYPITGTIGGMSMVLGSMNSLRPNLKRRRK